MSDKSGKYKNTKINMANARFRIRDDAEFNSDAYYRMTKQGYPEKIGLSKPREDMLDQTDIPLYEQLERHSGHPTTKDEEAQQEAKKKALMGLARNPKIGSKSQT